MYKELLFHEGDVGRVCGLEFGVQSPADILADSVVEVKSTETYAGNEPLPHGLFDTRMGVVDHGMVCRTCGMTNAFCPGHFGHISVEPVFYVQFIDVVRKLLRCVCFRCSALLVSPEAPEVRALHARRMTRQKRWEAMYKLCSKARKCEHCSARQADRVSCTEDMKIWMEWRDGDNALKEELVLGAKDALRIFRRVTEEDADALGFSSRHNRPEWLICTVLAVPPPQLRPSVRSDTGLRSEDDITHILRDVVKINLKIQERIAAGASYDVVESLTALLQYHVSTIFNNSVPTMCATSRDRMGRVLRTIADRLKGKEGRIRGNLIGKRVDMSARTVITPDPNLSIEELGVPLQIAMNLTFPEVVNARNLERMRQLVRNGPDVYPGAKHVRKADQGHRTIRLKGNTSDVDAQLAPGDVVERHMLDGDYVLFNRQPSLHKMSMMAHKTRVMPHKTFRLNVCVCSSYNADFDGDEMNLHLPQTLQTHEEIRNLAAVQLHIVSPRNSVPIINIVQDVLLGVFRMTQPHVRVSPVQFMNLVSSNPLFAGILPQLPEEGSFTGQQLLSTVFPAETNLRLADGKDLIRDGQVMKGPLNGGAFKRPSSGIVHAIFNDQGPAAVTCFLNSIQKLTCDWLVLSGFSVGMADLERSKATRDTLRDNLQRMKMRAVDLIREVHNGRFKNESTRSDADYFEAKMDDIINEAKKANEATAMNSASALNNRMLNMIGKSGAGSKGSEINFLQMVACVGQQNIDGKRIADGFDHRTLPHFTKFDDSPVTRGFVERSFVEGLSPNEFFYHSMGGRIGLIDTAVRSVTGDTRVILTTPTLGCRMVRLGEWVDGLLEAAYASDPASVTRFPADQMNMELMQLSASEVVCIPTVDARGGASWGRLTAVTRHDPGHAVYDVRTRSGRRVTVADSESLLVWRDGRFVPTQSKEVREGDALPVIFRTYAPEDDGDHTVPKNDGLQRTLGLSSDYEVAADLVRLGFFEACIVSPREGRVTWTDLPSVTTAELLVKVLSRVGVFAGVVATTNDVVVSGGWANLLCSHIVTVCPRESRNIVPARELMRRSAVIEEETVGDAVLDPVVEVRVRSPCPEKEAKLYDVTVPSTLNFVLANGLGVRDTSDTGYIQRKLVKSMEDCKVYHDYTVRNAAGHIVQFMYGEDGADSAKLEYHNLEYVDMDDGAFREQYLLAHPDELEPYVSPELLAELRKDEDGFAAQMLAHFRQLQEDKRFVCVNVLGKELPPDSTSNVVFPVSLERILTDAEQTLRKYGVADQRSDLDPREVLRSVEDLERRLRVGLRRKKEEEDGVVLNDAEGGAVPMMGVLLRAFLSPSKLLRVRRLHRVGFEKVLADITASFFGSLVNPGEMVGIVAAQSIGEPTSQSTLNSVHYDEELLLSVDGKLVRTKIGDFTHGVMDAADPSAKESHPKDVELTWIRDRDVKVLAGDEDGKVAWHAVEAVTRHPVVNEDGTDTLLHVTTRTGRAVTATKGKSFLKRVHNKIVAVNGSDLRVGDRLPVSTVLPTRDVAAVDHLNVADYLPPDAWLYMSQVEAALAVQATGTRHWYDLAKSRGIVVPYNRSDSFIAAFVGQPSRPPTRRDSCLPGNVYPATISKRDTLAHIPERIPLDEDFGWLVGAYLAEGCIAVGANKKGAPERPYGLLVCNMQPEFRQRFDAFCERYEIGYHVDAGTRLMKSGNRSPTVTLRMHSLLLGELFMKMFGTGAAEKRIDPVLFGAPDEFLRGLLDGYWSGDGFVSKEGNMMSAYSASGSLLVDMQQILVRFGIMSSLHRETRQRHEQNLERFDSATRGWTLFVPACGCARFRDVVTLCVAAKRQRLDDKEIENTHAAYDVVPDVELSTGVHNKVRRSRIAFMLAGTQSDADREVLQRIADESIFYDEIVSIEEVPNAGRDRVYDLTVADTRNFNLLNGLALVDTFHLSGVSSASGSLTLGVPRLNELFNGSRKMKTPQMEIFLKPRYAMDKEKCEEVMNGLQIARFRDVVRSSAVFFDPHDDPDATVVREDSELLRLHRAYSDFMLKSGGSGCERKQSPWLLRFEFDRSAMLDLQVTMSDVHFALLDHFKGELGCVLSDDGSDALVGRLRLQLDPDFDRNDILTEVMALEQSILDNVVIRGVKDIEKAIMEPPMKEHRVFDPDSGTYVKRNEWRIITAGTNLMDVMANPYVDGPRTYTNNVFEVLEVLGIEAARAALFDQIDRIIHMRQRNEVNYRHLIMLVDTMTNRGNIIPIDRHGIKKSDVGPLAKSSFEETDEMLIKAGVFCEVDKMNGVAANIMLGQVAPCGTGYGDVIVDTEAIVREVAATTTTEENDKEAEEAPAPPSSSSSSGNRREKEVSMEALDVRAAEAKGLGVIREEDDVEIV